MADNFGWRWAFWLNVPIAIGSLVIILTTFPAESHGYAHFNLPVHEKIKRLDPIGACALIASLASLIVVLQSYSTSIELSRRDVILAIVAGASLLVFAFHETFVRPDLALIPRRIFVHRAVWSCCLMLFLLFAGFINYIFFLSIFFQVRVIAQLKNNDNDKWQRSQSRLNQLSQVLLVCCHILLVSVSLAWLQESPSPSFDTITLSSCLVGSVSQSEQGLFSPSTKKPPW